jgi:hypothetical protein
VVFFFVLWIRYLKIFNKLYIPKIFSLAFFSKIVIVLCLKFKHMMYFCLLFVNGLGQCYVFLLPYGDLIGSTIYFKAVLPPLDCFYTFVINQLSVVVSLFLGLLFYFNHLCIYPCTNITTVL